jgi:hypothetical protein
VLLLRKRWRPFQAAKSQWCIVPQSCKFQTDWHISTRDPTRCCSRIPCSCCWLPRCPKLQGNALSVMSLLPAAAPVLNALLLASPDAPNGLPCQKQQTSPSPLSQSAKCYQETTTTTRRNARPLLLLQGLHAAAPAARFTLSLLHQQQRSAAPPASRPHPTPADAAAAASPAASAAAAASLLTALGGNGLCCGSRLLLHVQALQN